MSSARCARTSGPRSSRASCPRSVRLAEAPSHGVPITQLRPELAQCGRVLPARARGRRAWLALRPRGLGLGALALLLGEPQAAARAAPARDPARRRSRRTRASRARASTRSASPSSSRVDHAATASCSPCSCAGRMGRRLRADRRRAPLARRAGGRAEQPSPRSCARPTTATSLALALVENVVRADLDPSSRRAATRGCGRVRAVARGGREAVGRSRTAVDERDCACSSCPTRCSRCSSARELSEGHGRALLQIDGPGRATRAAAEAVGVGGRCVRQTECARAAAGPRAAPTPARRRTGDSDWLDAAPRTIVVDAASTRALGLPARARDRTGERACRLELRVPRTRVSSPRLARGRGSGAAGMLRARPGD